MAQVHEFMNTESPSGKTLSLGIDDEAHLYVNGKKVITEQKVTLRWWIDIAVVLGALGAFTQGIVAICTLYK